MKIPFSHITPLLSKFTFSIYLFFTVITSTCAAPETVFNVREYGAKGDGITLDSNAINNTITTAVKAGGGTVYFPAGTYLSYSIRLESHIALYLDQGAVILGATPSGELGYDMPESAINDTFQDFGHSHWHNSLIWGENLQDISILGPGLIHGKGLSRGGPYKAPVGNKAIALKSCRNVTLKDFTILYGGHFGILATGVDNLTVDNLKIDTNRDGIDIDCCKNVRISNCSVNSPWDDGICLKSSFALGYARPTENVTITNCSVSGFDRGTFYNGTYQRNEGHLVPDKEGPTGRIKFGTESNGGFKNITISNCVFEFCRGLALETVDGGLLEDVTITNITMRDIINSPIFLRLGGRMRAPDGTAVGALRRINISNITVFNTDSRFAVLISGIPNHEIEDVRLNNISIWYRALDSLKTNIQKEVPEFEKDYPEPQKFGVLPVYGFFIRHAKNIELSNINLYLLGKEVRPAIMLTGVRGIKLRNITVPENLKSELLVLKDVSDLSIKDSKPFKEVEIKKLTTKTY
ncbi:glycoside hydrolase family 28 protein [Flavobacterium aquidurense]|uniref:rhamnogalacturonidase n=1 Tax=Flavobacterium aquidurense TaxID=362413 RepID=UPI002865D042|nr:glycoside hydrolase family 28 protein [Flavobacterium aquidurense]MDR7370247.1 polygalacturonase [Flavobacterium aquidurense]